MIIKYPALKPEPLSEGTPFIFGDSQTGFCLADFWVWSYSSLLNNLTRGHLAEFIVARALGIAGTVRHEWAPFDLLLQEPGRTDIKIEVKSAAYLQEWGQRDFSSIQFSIRETREWDEVTGQFRGDAHRQSDVYVFALLHHKEKETVNPLNLEQWTFYVVPTTALDQLSGSQKSISLGILALEKAALGARETGFLDLRGVVLAAVPV